MGTTLDDWNERYRSREGQDLTPDPLLATAAQALSPGRALDLACGAGRNTHWLAERGWSVVALDGASEAIRMLHAFDPCIDARVVDLENGAPLPFADASFDLVAILYYLHRPLFAEADRVLRTGGIMVAAALTSGRFRVEPGELERTFSAYEILHSREGDTAELIARKGEAMD